MPYTPTDTITHSKILAFSCPSRFEKLHVLKLRDDSDPARRGSTVHTAHEKYLGMLVRANETSSVELAQLALHEAIVAETTPAHLIPDCEYLWNNHVESFELDLDAFLEAEQRRVVADFSFKPDYAYAKPDAFELYDIKTHYQALTPDGAHKDLQARMYCYLASKVWPGWQTYRFTWKFIRLRQTVTTEFSLAELDAVERQLHAHVEAIKHAEASGHYPAAPGQQCAYCTFACPEVDHAAKMPARILSADEAIVIAENLTVLRQAVTQQQKVLEQYAALHGPVTAAGYEWAHRPYERLAFPVAPTVDLLRQWQADTSKVTVGTTSLRSFLTTKKWAFIKPDLEALAVKKAGTAFSAKKVDVEGEEDADGVDA